MKEELKHEHFDPICCKFISETSLNILSKNVCTTNVNNVEVDDAPVPQSTFNLSLKQDEQEAKDNLILPYLK